MPRFQRKKITADAAGIKHGYRSGLEKRTITDVEDHDLAPNYEATRLEYIQPETRHTYTPDFHLSPHIMIETKGRWTVDDRLKMLYLKEQYPDIDFRMVFQNAAQKIKKGSKTSYADWCDKHEIKWASKQIPEEWYLDVYQDIAEFGEVKIQEEKDKPKREGGRGR
ncbi:MAG: hypothetical protein J6Y02_13240 [Pseudobutyrivibrio sp.]|nr:hypothetical protein [Pseudobutyrivibrio sp.]